VEFAARIDTCCGDGDAGHGCDVAELLARTNEQVQIHRFDQFALDQQVDIERQRVDGGVDRALDGILDRYDTQIRSALVDAEQDVAHGRECEHICASEIGLVVDRLFAEGSRRTKERNPWRTGGVGRRGHPCRVVVVLDCAGNTIQPVNGRRVRGTVYLWHRR